MENRIPDAELELLRMLWERAPLTARELAEAAYGETGVSAIGTVQKLLQRLEGKGLIGRDRGRPIHQFRPLMSRDEVVGRQVELLAEKLTDGSLTPILMHLVQARKLSGAEREELMRMLEDGNP